MSARKGCLTTLLVGLAMLVWVVWMAGQPARHSREVREAIRPGMSCWDVAALPMGRHLCFFHVRTNDAWMTVSREEFAGFLDGASNGSPVSLRLDLTFIGLAPNRSTLYVGLDSRGCVTNVSEPFGWD